MKFATTIPAYITLTFAFLLSWAEMVVYVYAILVYGSLCWDNELVIGSGLRLHPEVDSGQEPVDQGYTEFEFPESPSYHALDMPDDKEGPDLPSPTDKQDFISMGTSAPISIAMPKNYRGISAKGEEDLHGEIIKCSKLIAEGKLVDAQNFCKRLDRHQILPRVSIQLAEAGLLSVANQDIASNYHGMFGLLHNCKSVCHAMLQVKDSQAIALALSENASLALHKMAGTVSPYGSFEDAAAGGPNSSMEALFWKYWTLDVECCIAKVYLLQGLLQILSGRHLKGAVYVERPFTA
ncbi:hypothetical protein HDU91_000376 [Kappamyces sp. JEL0680]|nr:hypothetical protein HDU91_000376 [Kappamyces sp. JEL0680]